MELSPRCTAHSQVPRNRPTCARSSLTGSGPSGARIARLEHFRRHVRSAAARKAARSTGTFAAPKCRTCGAPYGSTSLPHHARCYQPPEGDHQGTLCPTKPAGQVTAACSQESSTAMARLAELFGLFMILRIAHAPAQHVTCSSFVEQGVYQRGRKATEASTSAWADLWRNVWRDRVTPSRCAR